MGAVLYMGLKKGPSFRELPNQTPYSTLLETLQKALIDPFSGTPLKGPSFRELPMMPD